MSARCFILALVTTTAALLPGVAESEDILDAIEAAATDQDSLDSDCSHTQDAAELAAAPYFLDVLLGTVGFAVIGGVSSYQRMQPDPVSDFGHVEPRRFGDPALPFVAVDRQWMKAGRGVSGDILRIEVGYGPVAGVWRRLAYRVPFEGRELSLLQTLAVYRMSFPGGIELGVGAGPVLLRGSDSATGTGLDLPLRIQATRHFGVQGRAGWSWLGGRALREFDVGIVASAPVLSLQLGYRWWGTGSTLLHGPRAGLTISF